MSEGEWQDAKALWKTGILLNSLQIATKKDRTPF
jgi:hypothetical protein